MFRYAGTLKKKSFTITEEKIDYRGKAEREKTCFRVESRDKTEEFCALQVFQYERKSRWKMQLLWKCFQLEKHKIFQSVYCLTGNFVMTSAST